MRTNRLEAPQQRDIRLDLIGMNQWRVCDRRLPENDKRAVLGTIARHDSRYVVDGARHGEYGSLSAATASFVAESQ